MKKAKVFSNSPNSASLGVAPQMQLAPASTRQAWRVTANANLTGIGNSFRGHPYHWQAWGMAAKPHLAGIGSRGPI
jgi:hypothetical protein